MKILVQSYGNTMFFMDATNFINIENYFNLFWSIFSFFKQLICTFFWHKYILTSHHMKLTSLIFFSIWFLCVLAYHNMQKHFENPILIMTWLRFKYGHLWKIVWCDFHPTTCSLPPIMCFHPTIEKIICTIAC
jgi:hypothetical protein